MKALVLLFWQMLRFKRSPEDAPYSAALLLCYYCLILYLRQQHKAVGRPISIKYCDF
jgi:hypothetical protein